MYKLKPPYDQRKVFSVTLDNNKRVNLAGKALTVKKSKKGFADYDVTIPAITQAEIAELIKNKNPYGKLFISVDLPAKEVKNG